MKTQLKTQLHDRDADSRGADFDSSSLVLRLPDVLRRVPVSKSTFWLGIKDGRFPAPHHIGRIAVWASHDIDDLVHSITAGSR